MLSYKLVKNNNQKTSKEQVKFLVLKTNLKIL